MPISSRMLKGNERSTNRKAKDGKYVIREEVLIFRQLALRDGFYSSKYVILQVVMHDGSNHVILEGNADIIDP